MHSDVIRQRRTKERVVITAMACFRRLAAHHLPACKAASHVAGSDAQRTCVVHALFSFLHTYIPEKNSRDQIFTMRQCKAASFASRTARLARTSTLTNRFPGFRNQFIMYSGNWWSDHRVAWHICDQEVSHEGCWHVETDVM